MPAIDTATDLQSIESDYEVAHALHNGELNLKSLQARTTYLGHALNKQMQTESPGDRANKFKQAVTRLQKVDINAKIKLPELLLTASKARASIDKKRLPDRLTLPKDGLRRGLAERNATANRLTRACQECKDLFAHTRKIIEPLLDEAILRPLDQGLEAMNILEESLLQASLFEYQVLKLQVLITLSTSDLKNKRDASEDETQQIQLLHLLEQLPTMIAESIPILQAPTIRKVNDQTLLALCKSARLRHTALCKSLNAAEFDHAEVLLKLAQRHELRPAFSQLLSEIDDFLTRYRATSRELSNRVAEEQLQLQHIAFNTQLHTLLELPDHQSIDALAEAPPMRGPSAVQVSPPAPAESNLSDHLLTVAPSASPATSEQSHTASEETQELVQSIRQTGFAAIDWVRQDAEALAQTELENAHDVAQAVLRRAEDLESLLQGKDWQQSKAQAQALQIQLESEITELNEWLKVFEQSRGPAQETKSTARLPEEKIMASDRNHRWQAKDAVLAPAEHEQKPTAKPRKQPPAKTQAAAQETTQVGRPDKAQAQRAKTTEPAEPAAQIATTLSHEPPAPLNPDKPTGVTWADRIKAAQSPAQSPRPASPSEPIQPAVTPAPSPPQLAIGASQAPSCPPKVEQTFEMALRATLSLFIQTERRINALSTELQSLRDHLLTKQQAEHVSWYALAPATDSLEHTRFNFWYTPHQYWARPNWVCEQNFIDVVRTLLVDQSNPQFNVENARHFLNSSLSWLRDLNTNLNQIDYFTQMARASVHAKGPDHAGPPTQTD